MSLADPRMDYLGYVSECQMLLSMCSSLYLSGQIVVNSVYICRGFRSKNYLQQKHFIIARTMHAHPTDVATMGGGSSKDQVTISAATGDKATGETTNGTVSTDRSSYMTHSHLLRLSRAINHYVSVPGGTT